MNLILVGLNHKTAPIEIRERFYLQPLERELILSELKNDPHVIEALVLSTCNRTEIYANLLDNNAQILFDVLFKIKKMVYTPELGDHFYIKESEDVVKHLFEVACGLNSLVIGEKQILGQVREAADLAERVGILNKIFHTLINIAINAGKTAQAKTRIGSGGSSVSWAAVVASQKMLGSLEGKNILIIGAGKMSQLTAGQLLKKSVTNIFVMNRTFEKAQTLAEKIGGKAVMFWDLKNILARVDACICSSGAPHFVIESDLLREVMALRQNKPLLLIDISTPRNINPEVSLMPHVQLVSMDDLNLVIEGNMQSRQIAMNEVNEIIARKISFFNRKIMQGSYYGNEVYSY